MSAAKRPPAPPPALPGFTYVDVLGSGGFADVYLYEQHLPRRRVAVKVMLPDRMASGSAEQFTAEANVMALLSTHPAIVTIYQAGVSDDGRPYLVMEYCSRPNLQVRSRAAAFSVAEALRVGVQVAAAVETAHRAGILHRDIKPANILVTEYNRPALTDFGIATTAESEESSAGMSIPWSPPESFSDVPGSGVATDVYALGATVYTLLAGRSPFEQPGGRNGGADLIQRIESQPVPRLERADAPPSLQAVLERAMAKRPGDRYDSAIAFARALQRVQIELAHSVTPIDILDDAPEDAGEDDVDGELTRVRGIVSIEPQTHPAAGPTRRRDRPDDTAAAAPAAPAVVPGPPVPTDTADPTLLRGPVSIAPQAADLDTSSTIRRPGPAAAARTVDPAVAAAASPSVADPAEAADAAADAPAPRTRRGLWIGLGIAAAVVVVAGVAVGASLVAPAVQPPADDEPTTSAAPQDPLGGYVPPVEALAGTVQGGDAVFTWTNPEPQDGDGYLWYPYTLAGDGETRKVTETSVTLPVDAGGTTCIAVTLVRKDGTAGTETRKCTP
ncbi:serine/threonine protein kinase [Microbacterium hominis]|uniref:serine/threonine-protein kinase n=1 Tax=Microbacterium TaxID=33882 RepID=UPI00168AC7E2|nr:MULTISPECIES: serine/threonine-protein kinase [Microbacterium]QOC26633.1 serine/threonine protein kinase [Microbacterium hominis]QOC27806.1 serine/threonine protein kinase [Microbacterium hominis]QYF97040.1 serine/threonine protein kinase [Microbacterium sp. PAMC21962]